MNDMQKFKVAIIDYNMGNLFSIVNACKLVNLDTQITSSAKDIDSADAIILPGVGSFGKAMHSLENLKLVDVLKENIKSGKPFMGICLGMQLLLTKSYEFGEHKGLDLLKGEVIHFSESIQQDDFKFKIPHIGWNTINKNIDNWSGSHLSGLEAGDYMYFVHSFYVKPEDKDIILSTTRYGNFQFCSSLQNENIFACQFHPERSAQNGIKIYKNFANYIEQKIKRSINV